MLEGVAEFLGSLREHPLAAAQDVAELLAEFEVEDEAWDRRDREAHGHRRI